MKKKKKLSTDEYFGILKNLDLRNISLESVNTEKDTEYTSQKLGIRMTDRTKFIQSTNLLNVLQTFTLVAKAEDKEKPAFKLKAVYKLEFQIKEHVDLSEEFKKMFSGGSAGIIIWPYLRELIQGILTRMDMPPLTLPMIRGD